MNFEAMPRTRTQYYREFAAAVRGNPLSFIVPRTFIREFRGIVVYVSEKQGNLLRDIWVWELDDQKRVTRLIRAETGRLDLWREMGGEEPDFCCLKFTIYDPVVRESLNAGIGVLLGVTSIVLGCFARFFVVLAKRARFASEVDFEFVTTATPSNHRDSETQRWERTLTGDRDR